MTRMLFALSLGFAGVILATQAGFAEPRCGPRDAVLKVLAETYGETRRGIGLAPNSAVMEMFAAETGSWTITVTLADGQMCLLASGEAYQSVSERLPAKGDPA